MKRLDLHHAVALAEQEGDDICDDEGEDEPEQRSGWADAVIRRAFADSAFWAGSLLTGADGTAAITFVVPDVPMGEAALIVQTRTSAGEERLVHPVMITGSYRIYLSSDKSIYRPGQRCPCQPTTRSSRWSTGAFSPG